MRCALNQLLPYVVRNVQVFVSTHGVVKYVSQALQVAPCCCGNAVTMRYMQPTPFCQPAKCLLTA